MKIIGQEHLISSPGPIYKMIKNNNFMSFILYGPSGTGKTTIANYVCDHINRDVFKLNAANTSKSQLEQILKSYENQQVVILVDEVHRLDKQRQNLFLPYLEKENIILIGTTTENPIYNLHNAFLSRVLVFETKYINKDDIAKYLKELNKDEYKDNILDDEVILQIVTNSGGDLRKALQYFLFLVKNYKGSEITDTVLNNVLKTNVKFEADGDRHYDLISAFQKSIRASDVNAALFYLGHLLLSGDYPGILRRLVVIAYEDIGLANFNLTSKVSNAVEVFNQIGMPEGRIVLANIVIELALSPKSTTAYNSIDMVLDDVRRDPNILVPQNIRQNQDTKHPYNKDESFTYSNLPEGYKDKEYLKFKGNSTYEDALRKRYEQLKKEKNAKRNI